MIFDSEMWFKFIGMNLFTLAAITTLGIFFCLLFCNALFLADNWKLIIKCKLKRTKKKRNVDKRIRKQRKCHCISCYTSWCMRIQNNSISNQMVRNKFFKHGSIIPSYRKYYFSNNIKMSKQLHVFPCSVMCANRRAEEISVVTFHFTYQIILFFCCSWRPETEITDINHCKKLTF